MSGKRIVVRRARDTQASPSAIFALLRDSSTYPSWSQIRGYRMERSGFAEPHGVGEIRVFTSWLPIVVREEIVEVVPDRLVAYTLLSGLPMRDYRGETTLEPLASGGARIVWQSSFRGVAGTGWAMRLFMGWVLATLTMSLARAAGAAAPAIPPPLPPTRQPHGA